MIVDTSVWIDFFRGAESTAGDWIAEQIGADTPLVVPEVVLMELLIGTTDEELAAVRRRFLQRFRVEPLAALRDSEDAAALHRRCRRAGETVRSLIDCQIAAMARRLDLEVVHRDRDFEVISRNCGLRTVPLF